ncbi:auxin-responsive protein IAA16-like isoform X1 [Triticum urartu]|uniref:Auxin-responsive protein n=1 Tax=Triticum urartu TaxID=4572 RepID=A0A8R7NXG7_TRIUA|nr:auxin-responsive protein IAA16-like isoform X1 [Triticum urartu]XP_048539176.1 auxin-responsive protein IAA16-like isoform X1 [Triticum urartu]
MAWNGSKDEEERGLELSLGLPGYFSGSPGQEGLEGKGGRRGAAGAGAKGRSNGSKPSRPAAAAPVVGWPPVRSFRRNLASSSKPPAAEPRHGAGGKADGSIYKGRFVKINMDGVPIGRKVDLKAHGSYGKLADAVDHLFQGLLAAQRDESSCAGEKPAAITGLLDGSGEYTLVYEDDEGDQMLVGDVPWNMFIATAKRLRVLRSSDLNASSLRAAVSRKRGAAEC